MVLVKPTFMRTLAKKLPLLQVTTLRVVSCKSATLRNNKLKHLIQVPQRLRIYRLTPDVPVQKQRDFLGGFGFSGDRALSEIAPFSGEKARLALALLVWQAPNVLLLLDEPTNHLDMDMRDALTYALMQFEGAMVIISHDRHILRATCDAFFLVDQGQVAPFDGDLDDYGVWAQQQQARVPQKLEKTKPVDTYKRQKQLDNAVKLQSTLNKEEQKQIRLQEELERVETELGNPEIYENSQSEHLQTLLNNKSNYRKKLKHQKNSGLISQTQMDKLNNSNLIVPRYNKITA